MFTRLLQFEKLFDFVFSLHWVFKIACSAQIELLDCLEQFTVAIKLILVQRYEPYICYTARRVYF